MDKTQEQKNIDSFNKVQQELGTGKQFVTGQGLVPQNQIPTLSKDTLGTGNQPMNIAPRNTGTSAVGFGAEITSLSNAGQVAQKEDTLLQQQNTQVSDTQKNLENSKKAILNKYGLTQGETALTDKAYSETNQLGTSVDATAKKLRDINSRINAIDISANEEIKALDKNFYGTTSGKNEAINAINRRATSAKADLYIDKLVTQGEYDSAKNIADRKVNVQMEQDRLDLEKLKFDYAENKDLFTKSEQRQFELMADNRKRELDKTAADAKAFETTKIDLLKSANEQNAPQSVKDAITRSTNVTEAINAAGQYSGDILARQMKQAQIQEVQAKAAKALADSKYADDPTLLSSPLVNAIVNVNAGSAEGQQKRDTERIAQFVKNNQPKQAQEFILSRVTSKMSATEREAELDRRNTIDALSDIQSALLEYKNAGGTTDILTGGVENIANKIGNTSDPKLASIKAKIIQATQKYRNSITGAAWGDQETAEYKAIFPSISNTEKLNGAIIDTMIPLLKNNEKNAIGLFLGGSDIYDSVFGSSQNSSTPTKTVKVNGNDYEVGRIYTDGTANWVVDANGKWTKQ